MLCSLLHHFSSLRNTKHWEQFVVPSNICFVWANATNATEIIRLIIKRHGDQSCPRDSYRPNSLHCSRFGIFKSIIVQTKSQIVIMKYYEAHGKLRLGFSPFLDSWLRLLLFWPRFRVFAGTSVRYCGISLMRCAGHPVAVWLMVVIIQPDRLTSCPAHYPQSRRHLKPSQAAKLTANIAALHIICPVVTKIHFQSWPNVMRCPWRCSHM